MSEWKAIEKSGDRPVTEESLAKDFSGLGLKPGMTVIVHSSLSSLGWVCGGPVAVIRALERVLTPEGTLVMPAHSGDLSDPGRWQNPPVPETWWEIIRCEMPVFEPDLTPSRGMGVIAETFRKQNGVVRSSHPSLSFCAWGKHRLEIVSRHSLSFSLGEKSPLARLYDLDGMVLLLGVGHDSNTSIHLAEYRSSYAGKMFQDFYAPVADNGVRVWKAYRDLEFDLEDFSLLGDAFEASGGADIGKVGLADARLFRQRAIVDFAGAWFRDHRGKPES